MSTERWLKLFDVDGQTDWAIARTPTTFANAYSEIKTLLADIEMNQTWNYRGPFTFSEKNYRRIINCTNPKCYGGGIDLDHLLKLTIIACKLTTFEKTLYCCGYEGSPKGRQRTGSCDTSFRVKIAVEYNEQLDTE